MQVYRGPSLVRFNQGLVKDRPRFGAGFTLIEALLVLAIGGILTGIAVPSILAARRGYQIHTAAITITNRFAEARTHALKRNRPVNVTLDVAAGTLLTTYMPPGGVPVTIAGPEFLPSGVVFEAGGAASLVVTFDSMGRPLNPPQSFRLLQTSSRQVRLVTVLSTGRLTVN